MKNFDDIIKEMERKIKKNLYPSKTFKIIDGKKVPLTAAEIREYLGPEIEAPRSVQEKEPKAKPRLEKPHRPGRPKINTFTGPLPQGVEIRNNRFVARISIKGKLVSLGIFDTAELASAAYEKARKERDKAKPNYVYFSNGSWTSQIRCPISNKNIFLGTFDTPEEASAAYQAARENIAEGIKIEKPTRPKVKPIGAYLNNGLWTSRIWCPISKKLVFLGVFDTPEEASAAYQAARKNIAEGIKIEKPTRPRKPRSKPRVNGRYQHDEKWKAEVSVIEAGEKFISKHFRNKTNFKGVKQRNGRYVATIQLCQKSIWLGTFDNAEAAHNAYQAARKKIDAEPSQEIASQKYKCADDFRDEKSKTKGVNLVKGKWTARLWLKNKNFCLGTFATEQEAIAAYESAKKKILAGETLEKTKPNTRKEQAGIYQIGKRWRSSVTFGCTTIWLGSFATKEDALAARQNAINKISKEPNANAIAQKYKTKEDFL